MNESTMQHVRERVGIRNLKIIVSDLAEDVLSGNRHEGVHHAKVALWSFCVTPQVASDFIYGLTVAKIIEIKKEA